MKITKFTLALLAGAVAFTSCSDDDDINEGRFDRAELFATSNTTSNITVYDFSDSDEVDVTTLTTAGSTDNEGLFYDNTTNQLIFGSRTRGSVSIADGIDEDRLDGMTSALTTTNGPTGLSSIRSIAVSGNQVVVANNVTNQLFVYTKSGSTLTLRNTVQVAFNLWEIQFNGNDLYAVVDNTNEIAQFANFLSANTTNAAATATKRIKIEGIVRTHGLVYNGADDIMVLTDIGEAANTVPGFDTDGGIHIIKGFTAKFQAVANNGTLPVLNNQVRISGSSTNLGNPISATYDSESNTIFIAERANSGGRILAFSADDNGNVAPRVNNPLPGASSVFFYGED